MRASSIICSHTAVERMRGFGPRGQTARLIATATQGSSTATARSLSELNKSEKIS